MKTTQVNVEIPEETLIRLKRTALDNRISIKDLALVAFERLLEMKPTQRSAALNRASKKVAGRKIALLA